MIFRNVENHSCKYRKIKKECQTKLAVLRMHIAVRLCSAVKQIFKLHVYQSV